MTFVQITYGSSINRQIKDTVKWMTSEQVGNTKFVIIIYNINYFIDSFQMILYYMNSFKKAFWTLNDKPKDRIDPQLTEDQKIRIATETKEALLQNIPEVLVTLVGQQAAVNGVVKVFETLQQSTLNKQLFYDILELVISELFPEITQSQTLLHMKSHEM